MNQDSCTVQYCICAIYGMKQWFYKAEYLHISRNQFIWQNSHKAICKHISALIFAAFRTLLFNITYVVCVWKNVKFYNARGSHVDNNVVVIDRNLSTKLTSNVITRHASWLEFSYNFATEFGNNCFFSFFFKWITG